METLHTALWACIKGTKHLNARTRTASSTSAFCSSMEQHTFCLDKPWAENPSPFDGLPMNEDFLSASALRSIGAKISSWHGTVTPSTGTYPVAVSLMFCSSLLWEDEISSVPVMVESCLKLWMSALDSLTVVLDFAHVLLCDCPML